MAFLSAPVLESGTAVRLTAIGCRADTSGTEDQREGRRDGWAKKWGGGQQRGERLRQRGGRGAVLKRKMRRWYEMRIREAVAAAG